MAALAMIRKARGLKEAEGEGGLRNDNGIVVTRGRASWFLGAVLLFSHSVVSNSLVSPWTVARQAPLSIGFSRQEYRSGLPFPTSGFDPGIKLASHILRVDSLPLSPREG